MDSSIFEKLVGALKENRLVLPVFPQIVLQIRDVVDSDDASAITVAREVAKDPALTARLLKVANSSLYGFSVNTSSLQQAISRVGLEHTKVLVSNFAMIQLMDPPKGAYGDLIRKVRNHSLEVAALAFTISEKTRCCNSNQGLMGGMLHAVGYLPLLQFAKKESEDVLSSARFWQLMTKLHCRTGHLVLSYWHFSPDMIDVVANYQSLSCEPLNTVTLREVVALANALVNAKGSDIPELLSSELAKKLGFTEITDDDKARKKEVLSIFS